MKLKFKKSLISEYYFLVIYYANYIKLILSIAFLSSLENSVLFIHPMLSRICDGLEAPTSTLVISPSLKIHDNAICAKVCPLFAAIPLNALTLFIFSSVMAFSLRKRPSVRTRLSSGIPLIYLSVNTPCSNGQNVITPIPLEAA